MLADEWTDPVAEGVVGRHGRPARGAPRRREAASMIRSGSEGFSFAGQADSARVHDFLIGAGKDAYEFDRAVGRQLIADANAYQMAVRAARLFLLRAVQVLVTTEQVGLVVELGCGYPCEPNVHSVATWANSAVHTLYVDNDRVVAAHGAALLLTEERAHFSDADLTEPADVIAAIAELSEPGVPVCICLSTVAEFLDDPAAVVKAMSASLPRGSYLALSHVTSDIHGDVLARATETYRHAGIGFHARSREEIAAILAGWDLLPPGLVPAHRWRPDLAIDHPAARGWSASGEDADLCCYGAVGRLP
ncbi:SAM-dependent methyltransferase [Nocardia niigatensis]